MDHADDLKELGLQKKRRKEHVLSTNYRGRVFHLIFSLAPFVPIARIANIFGILPETATMF